MQRLFQDSFIFFTFIVATSSSSHFLHNSCFSGAAISTEQLLFLRSSFFRTMFFSEQIVFSGWNFCWAATSWEKVVFQGSYFVGTATLSDQLLYRNYFCGRKLFQIKISTEKLLFDSGTSAQHQLFENKYFFNKATYSI